VRVLVAGAGFGGLTAYTALRHAGVEAQVFERAAEPGATLVGGGFHLWANAIRALRELGLDEAARERGVPLTRTEFRSSRGRFLGEWPLAEIARDLDAFDVGISRRDLMGLLHEAAGTDAATCGAELTSFTDDGSSVTASFADGRSETGDVLVGADGLRSVVRSALLGSAEPTFAGYVQWQALIDGAAELIPEGIERITFGPGSRTVMHRVGGGRLFLACALHGPDQEGGRAPGTKELLLERFRGWPEPTEAAIEAMPEDQILGLPVFDRTPVKAWGQGRVTLLGDAAHPMTTNTGQGGNQAIEDGVLLGRMLGEAEDPEAALRAYEQRRIARTTPLVKNSRWITNVNAWSDPLRVRFRDRFFSVGLPRKGLKDLRRAAATPL
jgi:2-polyprenyl-6-methoxyphenol hydroxylase-like FAD-dependent oxidoreductase